MMLLAVRQSRALLIIVHHIHPGVVVAAAVASTILFFAWTRRSSSRLYGHLVLTQLHLIVLLFVIVRYLVGVSLDMRLHFFLALERLVAYRALVAFRAVVLHPVQFQHMVIAKVPKADIAMVRFFACVRPGMDFQLLGARKALATAVHRTFVGLLT